MQKASQESYICDEHFLWSTKVDHVNDTYSVIATDVDEVWGILKKMMGKFMTITASCNH